MKFDGLHDVVVFFILGCLVCFIWSAPEVMDLVKSLPAKEAIDLDRMVEEWTAGIVDQKFEAAVKSGAFDAMAAEAIRELEAGATLPLREVLDDSQFS